MNKIIEYSDTLEHKLLGRGENGNCFLTPDNKVFKRFDNPSYYEKKISSLLGINVPTFVFPQALVQAKDVIIGYIMEYVEGMQIKYKTNQISISEYINALKVSEYDIAAISNLGIYSIDLKDENVLFSSDKGFKIIDTDFYTKTKDKKGLYMHNMGNFTYAVLNPLFDIYTTSFNDRKLRNEYSKLIDGKLLPSRFINLLLKYMSIEDTRSINLEEMSNELKLLYKKN